MVIKANKWLAALLMAFIFFGVLTIAVVFYIDPFLYYRNISNDKKLMEPRYANLGIMKNYKHDMTILGMDSDNYMDMLYIRNYHERRPVQLGIEDSNLADVLLLYTLAQENSKSDLYFINVNPEDFLEDKDLNLSSVKFPKYLYNTSRLDDIKYLLNYEICFRYIILNTVIDTAFKLNKTLPIPMMDGTEIDKVVQWKLASKPVIHLAKGVNKELHMEDFIKTPSITNINKAVINNKRSLREDESYATKPIEDYIDSYLKLLFSQLKSNQTLIFGFMPYTVAYWTNLTTDEFDAIMYAKEYFIKQCSDRLDVKIVDLQGISEISNPANYLNNNNLTIDLMKLYTDAIFDETYYSSSQSYDTNRKKLEKQMRKYLEK